MTVYGYEMAVDYTKVEPGLPAVFTVAGSRFTYQIISDTDGLYAYKDFTAGYFDDDFIIKFVWTPTGSNKDATYPNRVMLCTLVNALEDWSVNNTASEDQIGVVHYTDATKHYLAPVKSTGGATTLGDMVEITYGDIFYVKIERYNELKLTMSVYSDVEYLTLLGSSSITINDTDYRYFLPVQNYNYGAGSAASFGYVENISINMVPELIGWAKTLTSIEDRILDYLKAIDNDDFSFNDTNCGTRVVDAEEYPVCRLIFLRDDPEFKSYELTSRIYKFLLILETSVSEKDFSDAVATRDWLLQKRMIGAIVDLLDKTREDNPYWSLLAYTVNKDYDDEESIYDAGTTKIYLTVTHES